MIETKYDRAGEAMAAALKHHGFDGVSVEPSNVSRSPYRYVYVYFTDDGIEGLHALVSECSEYDSRDHGFLVGVHTSLDEETPDRPADAERVDTLDEVPVMVANLLIARDHADEHVGIHWPASPDFAEPPEGKGDDSMDITGHERSFYHDIAGIRRALELQNLIAEAQLRWEVFLHETGPESESLRSPLGERYWELLKQIKEMQ